MILTFTVKTKQFLHLHLNEAVDANIELLDYKVVDFYITQHQVLQSDSHNHCLLSLVVIQLDKLMKE